MAREMSPEDVAAVLSIGSVVGGMTLDPRTWGDAAGGLMRQVVELRADFESPLNVNVVFHIPGEVVSPDWEGVRTGRYDRATHHLMVQATVPPVPPDDPRAFLVDRLREAVTVAERWASRKGIADELPSLRAIIARL